LEWPTLQAHLVCLCLTPYGQELWQHQPFLPSTNQAIVAHMGVVCALQALLVRWGLPLALPRNVPNLTVTLRRLTLGLPDLSTLQTDTMVVNQLSTSPSYPVFGLPDLHAMANTITLASQLSSFIGNATGADKLALQPLQAEGTQYLQTLQPLYQTLSSSLTAEGLLNEDAFPLLANLRQQLAQQRQQIHRQLEAILRRLAQQPDTAMATQNQVITERNGRLVLPVRAGFQSSVPGWIHGASTGGGLVYIEPDTAIMGNNNCQMLLNQIETEQEKILGELSQQLGPHGPSLQALCHWLGQVDRCLAGAQLARQLDAHPVRPSPADKPTMLALHGVCHPLMLLQAKTQGDQQSVIVRNTVKLGVPARTLLITGPNTGGKRCC
jgi:DNA mismatch repair protein MutS2